MGREARIKPKVATPLECVLSPEAYWKLRASIGDVERAQLIVQQAQESLQKHLVRRQELLQAAAGAGVDINFISSVDWRDDDCTVMFQRAAPVKAKAG